MRLTGADLRGRAIITADGQVIGELAELVLESGTPSVDALHAKLRNEVADRFGAERSVFHPAVVEIPARMIQSVGDAVVLSVGFADLGGFLRGEGPSAPAPHG
jgi:sporulation protein YlmC with PRC-barrel domain